MQTMKYMCNALLLLMWAVLYVSIINAWTDIRPLSSFFRDEDSHHIFSDEDSHHIHEIFLIVSDAWHMVCCPFQHCCLRAYL